MQSDAQKASMRAEELAGFSKNLRLNSSQTFEMLKNPVFLVDLMGRFIYFNHAAEQFLGYTREEVFGRHFRLLLTLDDLSDGFLFLYQTLQGCYAEHTLFRVRRKDGSTRVIDLLASPISFKGKIRAALVIAEDITGRKSVTPEDAERVRVFKKFSEDLDRWNREKGSSPGKSDFLENA